MTILSEEEKREKRRAYGRQHYLLNKEHKKAVRKTWSIKNKEKIAETQRRYQAKNKNKIATYVYLRKYGITLEDKLRMLEEQQGLCMICETDTPGSKIGWSVDHDHKTGRVRGILCNKCNTRLGVYEIVCEDERYLNYLSKFQDVS